MRRSFDYLFVELSVELGELAPRYALWLALQEAGVDPPDLLAFFDGPLEALLDDHGQRLSPRRARRLRRRLARFDPRNPAPEETMARLFSTRT